jgi:hypothetical protein
MAITKVTRTLLSTGIVDNSNATAITIDSSENVGIGTTSPQGILHIDKGASGDNITILETHSAGDSKLIFSQGQTAGNWAIGYDDGSGADENSLGFAYRSDGYPSLTTHNQMILTATGRLGIGTTSPSQKLDIDSGYLNFSNNYGIRWNGATSVALYGNQTSNFLAFQTSSSERMRIDSSGNVGIGTDSPAGALHLRDTTPHLYIQSDDGQSSKLLFGDAADNSRGGFEYTSSDAMIFMTNNLSEKMRIDSSGIVHIGTGTAINDTNVKLQLNAPSGGEASLGINDDGAYALLLQYASGNYARIRNIKNTPMLFETNNTERMRIDSSGNVGIGTSSPRTQTHILGTGQLTANITDSGNQGGTLTLSQNSNLTNSGGALLFAALNDSGNYKPQAGIKSLLSNGVGQGTGSLAFSIRATSGDTALTERMRIDSSGNLLVGGTTPTQDDSCTIDQDGIVTLARTSGSGRLMQTFKNGGTSVGTITTTNTSTAYNTSSDARLKDVTGSARGLEVINELNPVSYNWKADGKADEGLIAQEVLDIVPNAVSGSEEEMYQMDYSKLVVHLVAGIKEQQTIIDDLKTRIETLENV